MYQAAYERELDVISGYSTDGRLKAYDLVTLQDDKRIFPPYYAAPVVRNETLQAYPELAPALNLLAGAINDSVMTELNFQADYLHRDPEAIAREFLRQRGLLRPARAGGKGTVRIGSKIFGEQYILAAMYRLLIEGHTDLSVATKTGLGGTKICFDALRNDQIDLYPEYTGTGLLVLLQAPPAAVDTLIADPGKVYRYVQQQFQRQYGITWLQPIGFNNAYALMMRRQQSAALCVASISDLKTYLDKK
jgi:osmoprotectant transport system permease protein